MSKRSKRPKRKGPDKKAPPAKKKRTNKRNNQNNTQLSLEDQLASLHFEDEHVDEFIVEEEYAEDMEVDDLWSESAKDKKEVYLNTGGTKNPAEPNAKLDYENDAYDALHRMTLEWPLLSFDFLTDKLGHNRTKYPHTAYMVGGTQSDHLRNKIIFVKAYELNKTRFDEKEEEDDSADEEDYDVVDEEAQLTPPRTIIVKGSVNRVKSMPQNPGVVVAQLSQKPYVQLFNATDLVKSLDEPPTKRIRSVKPLIEFNGHQREGYALAWNRKTAGRLLSGGGRKFIYVWNYKTGYWNVDNTPFVEHTDAVEDLQWSPTDPEVFASCSCDKTVKLWDCRQPHGKSASSVVAHNCDVNVISWNRIVPFLLLSGGDEGVIKLWDTRKLGDGSKMEFAWHRGPITSVEWSPYEDSLLAASSADNSISIWDLSAERDEAANEQDVDKRVPEQLLFLHQGQTDIKEIHWHRQIVNMLGSSSADGFHFFKPSNLIDAVETAKRDIPHAKEEVSNDDAAMSEV